MKPEKDRPLLPWALIIMFMVVSPALIIGGMIYSSALKTRMINNIKNELNDESELKVDQILQWKTEKMIDADVIDENIPIIRQVDNSFYSGTRDTDDSAIRSWMASFVKNKDYLNAAITDRNGRVRLAYPDEDSLIGPKMKPLIPAVLRTKKVILTDFHQSSSISIVHLDLIIPLLKNSYPDTMLTGLMILRVDPARILYPLLDKWSAKSKSSETLLLEREGDSVLYLNNLKLSAQRALTLKLPANDTKLIGAMAVNGKTGIAEGVDYRGVPVIASIRKVPGTNWFMISKIDRSEIISRVSGETLFVMLLVILLIVAAGAITGWTIWHLRVKFYRDLYRTRAEKLLLESHFSNILKYANDIILLLNSDLRIVQSNNRASEVYQYSHDELAGMHIGELRVPGKEEELKASRLLIENKGTAFYETTHRKKDGTTFPVEISVNRFEVAGETYYQSVGRDITERKRSAKQFEESNLMMRATIESTADGLLVVDNNGKILVYNQKFAEMWALPDELLESRDDERVLKFVTDKVRNPHEFLGTIKDLYKSDSKTAFNTVEFYDGRVIERYSQPFRLNDNNLVRVWSFRDVTEKIAANRQLMSAKERAEESDRLKTAFLHNVSHEIRTPMNAIVGFSALLDDPEIDQETRKNFTSIITESTNQLLALISDIVEISNIEAGQVKVSYSEVNINHLIRELVTQAENLVRSKGIEMKSDLSMDDSRAVINTDRAKIGQILGCFLNNAIKFTEKGSVMIGYRIIENDLGLYVKDTGIGIDPSMHEKVFDRFFQVEAGTSRQYSGAGLGLTIARSYADLLGCRIELNSMPGSGSEFILRHPL